MGTQHTSNEKTPEFQPLEIIGYFWIFMGIIVLLSSFFVEGNSYVPKLRGLITNIIAGVTLTGIGLFSIIRGKMKRKKDQSG